MLDGYAAYAGIIMGDDQANLDERLSISEAFMSSSAVNYLDVAGNKRKSGLVNKNSSCYMYHSSKPT